MKLAKRVLELEPSVTLEATAKAKALKDSGVDVIGLTVGEPDFATPKNIQDAAIAAIKSGAASFYTPATGILPLKQAIVDYLKRQYKTDYTTSQVVVTTGAKFALYCLFQAICDEGDEVIIPTPYWVSYGEQVGLADGVPVLVKGNEANEFKVTVEQLEAARTDKTVAILLNSPTNPTGMIYTRDELEAIGNWAVKNDILIIADDIYGELVYNGNEWFPISGISDAIKENTIVINGVSKTWSMTGWRVGYAVGPLPIIKAMADIISQATSNLTTASQYAAIEALNGPTDSIIEMREAFEARLNEAYPLVTAIPGFKLDKPRGAFYLFPNVREALDKMGYDDVNDFVNDLLEIAHVGVVTGAGFGHEDNIRLSYASDIEKIKEGIRRIHEFVESKIND
ncbi:MAG: pyridoxal phosphate-dependent aminotransferase [Lactobacillales bacterium]|jgi:aspartate/methionine/tyrosine aminotransferase|nr:pyridoxal phosphate-dependent aminotransferase [Lactobacillales bacterium]